MPANSDSTSVLRSFAAAVKAPWQTLSKFGRELLQSDERFDADAPIGNRIVTTLTLPFRLLLGCFTFLAFAWSSTRNGLAFFRGFPAMATILGYFAALVLADLIYNEARMIGTNMGYYQMHVNDSPDHPEWAEMFARKLTEIKPQDPEPKYLLGVTLERRGLMDKASDVMASIAPKDSSGYGPAHVWIANQALLRLETENQPEDFVQAERHLKLAEQATKNANEEADLEPAFRLARLYESQAESLEENPEEQSKYLKLADDNFHKILNSTSRDSKITYYQVIGLQPALKVRKQLAERFPEEYDANELNKRFAKYMNNIYGLARNYYPDEIALWQALVACAVELEQAERAITFIRTGLSKAAQTETKIQLRSLASRVKLVVAKRIKNLDNPLAYKARLEGICEAIQFNPGDKTAYAMLLDFVGKPDRVNEELGIPIDLKRLQQAGGTSEHAGVVYALVGLEKIGKGDVVGGKKSWRIGQQFESKTQVYIYQLLDVASSIRTEKFDNMLDIISTAIELFPDEPSFYVTRGVYLKNNQKYEEAISDFVHVIDRMPNLIVLNQQLKACYEKTGQTDKALEQAQLIEQKLLAQNEQERKKSRELLARLEARENENQ